MDIYHFDVMILYDITVYDLYLKSFTKKSSPQVDSGTFWLCRAKNSSQTRATTLIHASSSNKP